MSELGAFTNPSSTVTISDDSVVAIVTAARAAIRSEEEKLEEERKARDRCSGKRIWRVVLKTGAVLFFTLMVAGIALTIAHDYGTYAGLGATGFFGVILSAFLWAWVIE